MIKIICVSLTYYGTSKLVNPMANYAVDYSIPGFQLELGKIYDATEPAFHKDTLFYIEKNKTAYPKSLFRVVSEMRDEQIDSILND